jgi:2-polyprenyl-6-methoxyphenol hydroxylase-like FAD-dependent oxidoreductase
MEVMDETDVLIVGAGPTGLTLACDLRSRGIAVRSSTKRPARRRPLGRSASSRAAAKFRE